eukprot:1036039-Pelagomonas_calceolata.AAC.1
MAAHLERAVKDLQQSECTKGSAVRSWALESCPAQCVDCLNTCAAQCAQKRDCEELSSGKLPSTVLRFLGHMQEAPQHVPSSSMHQSSTHAGLPTQRDRGAPQHVPSTRQH